MTAPQTGQLSPQVLDLLSRLDSRGTRLVESWFNAAPLDVPAPISQDEMSSAVRLHLAAPAHR